MSYRERFRAMLAELEAHPNLELQRQQLGAGAPESAIASTESAIGRRLPDELRAFYAEIDGVEVRWRHEDERWHSFGAHGSIRIAELGSLRTFGYGA